MIQSEIMTMSLGEVAGFRVAMVGAGNVGQALRSALRKKGIKVALWDKNPERSPARATLQNTVTGADFLFFCIPSWALREAIKNSQPYLGAHTVVLSLAKGIEKDGSTTPDIFASALPHGQPFVFLGGPMLAKEIVRGKGAAGVASSTSPSALERVRELFANTSIVIECTDNPRATALCGVFKNVYAIGLGIAEGLAWENNRKGWLASRSMQEMASVFQEFEVPPETVYATAGAGDFLATGFSSQSMNHRAGRELTQTGKCSIKSEGICALPTVLALLGSRKSHYPLLTTLERVVLQEADARTEFENLFTHAEELHPTTTLKKYLSSKR